jgi:SlyX protein
VGDDSIQVMLGELQAEVAFQGDNVHRLNEALASQQQDVLMLQRQVMLLGEQLRALRENTHNAGSSGASEDNEPPPHY